MPAWVNGIWWGFVVFQKEVCFIPVNLLDLETSPLTYSHFSSLGLLLRCIFLSNWSEIRLLPIITDLNLYGCKNIMSYIKQQHILTPERFNSPSPHPHHNAVITYDRPGHGEELELNVIWRMLGLSIIATQQFIQGPALSSAVSCGAERAAWIKWWTALLALPTQCC